MFKSQPLPGKVTGFCGSVVKQPEKEILRKVRYLTLKPESHTGQQRTTGCKRRPCII
jgi:hypothetical protein